MSGVPELPQELLDEIIQDVALHRPTTYLERNRALISCSLACWKMCISARKYLFRDIRLVIHLDRRSVQEGYFDTPRKKFNGLLKILADDSSLLENRKTQGYLSLASNIRSLEVTFIPQRADVLKEAISLSNLTSRLESLENLKVEYRNFLDPRQRWPATKADLHQELTKSVALSSRLKELTIINISELPPAVITCSRSLEQVTFINVYPMSTPKLTPYGNPIDGVPPVPLPLRSICLDIYSLHFAGTLTKDTGVPLGFPHLQALELPATLYISPAVSSFLAAARRSLRTLQLNVSYEPDLGFFSRLYGAAELPEFDIGRFTSLDTVEFKLRHLFFKSQFSSIVSKMFQQVKNATMIKTVDILFEFTYVECTAQFLIDTISSDHEWTPLDNLLSGQLHPCLERVHLEIEIDFDMEECPRWDGTTKELEEAVTTSLARKLPRLSQLDRLSTSVELTFNTKGIM